jgi:hypothetical protein
MQVDTMQSQTSFFVKKANMRRDWTRSGWKVRDPEVVGWENSFFQEQRLRDNSLLSNGPVLLLKRLCHPEFGVISYHYYYHYFIVREYCWPFLFFCTRD